MAFESGIFYEVHKYARNYDLPLYFVVEDNGVSTNTPTLDTWGGIQREIPEDVIYYKYKSKYPLRNRKMGSILVTGCSGLVGTHIVEKLIEKNYKVVGVDIKVSNKINDNWTFHYLDLRDADEVSVLFDEYKFDGVINAFGIKGSPVRQKKDRLIS